MTAGVREARAGTVRLGFAGLGWIGLHRMKALLEDERVEAAGLCDASQDAVARAKEHCPDAPAAACFEDLLGLDLDGVVIATPSAQHAQLTMAALDAGVAVFCQKPLARTAKETRAVVDAARRADRLLHVDLSYRFTEAAQSLRELVAGGALGEIFACDLTFHNAYGPDKPWYYDVTQSGGGCVMDLGVHLVDLALWMLPGARIEHVAANIFAGGVRVRGPSEAIEDYATADMSLSTGAQLRIACSWNLHAGRDAVIEAVFHGSRGGAGMRNVNGSFYDFVAERFNGAQTRRLCEPPDAWGGRAAMNWASALRQGGAFDSGAKDYVRVAEALDAFYGRS